MLATSNYTMLSARISRNWQITTATRLFSLWLSHLKHFSSSANDGNQLWGHKAPLLSVECCYLAIPRI